jgi:uncharacterized membrane protein
MRVLYQVLLVLHVMGAALWFGGTAFVPRALREALAEERAVARRRIASFARQMKVILIAGLATFLTGLALALLWPGGFKALPVRFHISLLLALVWVGIGLLVNRPSGMRAAAIIAGDGPIEPAQALVKRIAAVTGVQHLLFTVILVLMLWRL